NPWTRFLTAQTFKSEINGLARIYYRDSHVLDEVFRDGRLYDPDQPHIYHNAWRMGTETEEGRIQIFCNHRDPRKTEHRDYLSITPQSLCACSALPFIEESVKMPPYEYTEGALVDTVNFANLLRDHPALDEIWVSRIVDENQVKPARTLSDALANLPMQF